MGRPKTAAPKCRGCASRDEEIARLKRELAGRGAAVAYPNEERTAVIVALGERAANQGETPCGKFCRTFHEHVR